MKKARKLLNVPLSGKSDCIDNRRKLLGVTKQEYGNKCILVTGPASQKRW